MYFIDSLQINIGLNHRTTSLILLKQTLNCMTIIDIINFVLKWII